MLLPEGALRAGVQGLRLTFLDGEQANFGKVVEALRLLKDPVIDGRLDAIAAQWKRVEEGQIILVIGDGSPVAGRRIRDAWLYGRVSHHRGEWKSILVELREHGELAIFALQASILGHARLVLRLDASIAEILDEPLVWEKHEPGEEQFF